MDMDSLSIKRVENALDSQLNMYSTEKQGTMIARSVWGMLSSIGLNYVAAVVGLTIPMHYKLGGDAAWAACWVAFVVVLAVRGWMGYLRVRDLGIAMGKAEPADTVSLRTMGDGTVILRNVFRDMFCAAATAFLVFVIAMGTDAEYLKDVQADAKVPVDNQFTLVLDLVAVLALVAINLMDCVLVTWYHHIKAAYVKDQKDAVTGDTDCPPLLTIKRWQGYVRMESWVIGGLALVHLAVVAVAFLLKLTHADDASYVHAAFIYHSGYGIAIGAVCLVTFALIVYTRTPSSSAANG